MAKHPKPPKPQKPPALVTVRQWAWDALAVRSEDAMAFLVRIYPASTPPVAREIAFQWTTVESATSYVLQVGTASGLTDVFHQDVGYVLSYPLTLTPRHYFVRTVPMIGSVPTTPTGEQEVTV